MNTIKKHFSELKDYRREKSVQYSIIEIVMLTITASICGCETWYDIENFGNKKINWLRKFLDYPNGIPSEDTIRRFFTFIDSEKLNKCFENWVRDVSQITKGEIISIDGKTIRGASNNDGKSLIHIVSAWANDTGLSFGQLKVNEKSNEITAIPKLLEKLEISGCFITIDAMGCQTKIANDIDFLDGTYFLAVKENQKELYNNIIDSFRFLDIDSNSENIDVGHGRIETRKANVIYNLSHVERPERWKNLSSIIKIESERYIKSTGKTQTAIRYYISNSKIEAKKAIELSRKHWGIENNLHWQLDVSFNEDRHKKREGNSAENFSLINKMALSILKKDKSFKGSINSKRLNAIMDMEYTENILKNY